MRLKSLIPYLFIFLVSDVAKGQTITTVAGGATGHGGYWRDGILATAAQLDLFAGLLVDSRNNIYISEGGGNIIVKVDATTGIITTIAGTGVAGYNGDGIPATSALLSQTVCISFDGNENLYIYDYGNNRIRRVDATTGIISTYAGNGLFGDSGDGGPATNASIDGGDMAWDSFGNLYYGATRKIRKITPSGYISTFVGNGLSGVTGEGVPATSTYIAPVRGIAIDVHDNIYLLDSTRAVRKISSTTGLINIVAGTGDNLYTYSGDGIAATTCHIGGFDISVDDTGNLYIADQANSRIEKVDTSGIIYTIAGTGVAGFSGDNGEATIAKISHPENVVLDLCNNVYIDDFNNARVRKVTYHATCAITDSVSLNATAVNINKQVSVYPNPTHDEVNVAAGNKITGITITNLLGQQMYTMQYNSDAVRVDMRRLPTGVYFMKIEDETGIQTITKVIKE